ncbi:hypothetical protein AAK964_12170 [Tissierella praeacuta]|uniref:hypothetical protein n=1 Tax=Tissierella praeacuta TaxID=43131 RepID=UPI003514B473
MMNKEDLILMMKELGAKGTDTVLEFYLQKSYNAIKHHLNYNDKDMKDNFEIEIVSLALFYLAKSKSEGLTELKQGERTLKYETIPQSVLETLPMPRVKVLG